MAVCCKRVFMSLAHRPTGYRLSWINIDLPTLKTTVSTQQISSNQNYMLRHITSQATNISSMSFEEYRKLRKNLKMRSRLAGVPLAFIGMGISSLVNVYMNPKMFEMTPEEVQPMLGLDPIVFSGICGAASAVVGYMLGGTVFTATWRMLSREKARQYDQKENEFLGRLQKHRYSEVSKYEDDYYGEKVLTLSDYRQWVRQQQKRKKAMQRFNESKNNSTTI